MGRDVDFGVFLPVTNNGWVISKTSPQFVPTFDYNRRIGQLAERTGFSYLFSMAKWRGFGGEVEFWKYAIESTMLMTALAGAVPSLRLIASVAPALIHPAVLAKMAATMEPMPTAPKCWAVCSSKMLHYHHHQYHHYTLLLLQ